MKPFFGDDKKVQTSRLRSDAQLNLCPQFLPAFPLSYFCWQDPPKRSSRRKVPAKNLWIFLKKNITWPRDFLLIFIAYFILPERNSLVKTISISADNDFPPLRRYISDVVIFLFNTLTRRPWQEFHSLMIALKYLTSLASSQLCAAGAGCKKAPL